MIYFPAHTWVFPALGSTDMRKAINGLSMMVLDTLDRNTSAAMFLCSATGDGPWSSYVDIL